jgi:hypothetical protein
MLIIIGRDAGRILMYSPLQLRHLAGTGRFPLLAQTGPPRMSAARPLLGAEPTLSKPRSASSIAAQIGGTHGESNEEEKVTRRGMDESYAL